MLVAGDADPCPNPPKREPGAPVLIPTGSNFGVAEQDDNPGADNPPKREDNPGADKSPGPQKRELGVVVVPAPGGNGWCKA